MKKILRTVSLLLMLNCTSSFAMTQEPYKDIWLEHLSEKNKFHVQVITKQAESCPIGLTSNGKKDYGMNFGMRFPYKHILESFPELIKNNTPEEPYKIYTFGCGSMPIFELHCILAGLYDGKQKIKVNMSDFQKEVIQKGSLFVFNALKKLKENDLKMPEIKDMYKTAVSRVPDDMDKNCFPDGKADLIVAASVAHFLGEKEICQFYVNAYKKLKPGGRLLVVAEAPHGEYVDLYIERYKKGYLCPGLLKKNKASIEITMPNFNKEFRSRVPNSFENVVPMSEADSPGDINKIEEDYKYGTNTTIDKAIRNYNFSSCTNSSEEEISMQVNQIMKLHKVTRSHCFNFLALSALTNIGTNTGFNILEALYVRGSGFFKENDVTSEMLKEVSDNPYQSMVMYQKPL